MSDGESSYSDDEMEYLSTECSIVEFNSVLPDFAKVTRFRFPRTHSSQKPTSTFFSSGIFPVEANNFISFSLICPSVWCHKVEEPISSATEFTSQLDCSTIYNVPFFPPRTTTRFPFITFHCPSPKVNRYPSLSN